jgi:glycosyltransferase involved in cell wall biosynthesis
VKSTHEPAQMADDILRLIGDPDARAKMGQAAAEWIAETQEMGKAADQLAAVYRNITGSH